MLVSAYLPSVCHNAIMFRNWAMDMEVLSFNSSEEPGIKELESINIGNHPQSTFFTLKTTSFIIIIIARKIYERVC